MFVERFRPPVTGQYKIVGMKGVRVAGVGMDWSSFVAVFSSCTGEQLGCGGPEGLTVPLTQYEDVLLASPGGWGAIFEVTLR